MNRNQQAKLSETNVVQREKELMRELLAMHNGSTTSLKAAIREFTGNSVGAPARGRNQCLQVLLPILQRYREDNPTGRLTQYKMEQMTTDRLSQNGIRVGRDIDSKTIRDTCKLVRLTCGDKNMGNYTIAEWKWLIKRSRKRYRDEAEKKVLQMLAALQKRMERENASIAALSVKYPGIAVPPFVSRLAEYTKRHVKYFQKVAALFP